MIVNVSASTSGESGGGIASATRHTLSNGIVALIHRNPNTPTVSVRGEIRVGAVNEEADQAGLASFTAAALNRGTEHRTFQQIVAETEKRGCSVSAGGGLHVSGFSGKALTEDLPLVLEILSDIIISPTFPEREIEKLRGQFLMHLREQDQDTHTQASRAARAMLYPSEHPYSRLSSGTVETVQHIPREAMIALHQLYHPAATTIAVVGDVEPDGVIAELERWFGPWSRPDAPLFSDLPTSPPLAGASRRDIPMAGKVQSDIVWGVHGLTRTAPDYYPAMVGNMILGRLGMGGRLGDNVRENQGLAYHISSGIQAGLGAGPWTARAGVNPANVERAVQAILHEIEQFLQEGPTDEELSDARAYLTGIMVLGLETNRGMAGALLDIEIFNLGKDFVERYPDIINGVSREAIIEAARTYLSTENYVLAVAGPEISQNG